MVFFPCEGVKSWLWVLAQPPGSPSVELPCSWLQQARAGSARQESADGTSRVHELGVHRLFADRYVYNGWSRVTWPKGEFPLLFRALDLEGELETVQCGLLPSSGVGGGVAVWNSGRKVRSGVSPS